MEPKHTSPPSEKTTSYVIPPSDLQQHNRNPSKHRANPSTPKTSPYSRRRRCHPRRSRRRCTSSRRCARAIQIQSERLRLENHISCPRCTRTTRISAVDDDHFPVWTIVEINAFTWDDAVICGCGDVCAKLLGVATASVGLDVYVHHRWVGSRGGPSDGKVGGRVDYNGCVCDGIG